MTPSAKQPPCGDFVTHEQCSSNRRNCAGVRRAWIMALLSLAAGAVGWLGSDAMGQHELNARQDEKITAVERAFGEMKTDLREIKVILLESLGKGHKP